MLERRVEHRSLNLCPQTLESPWVTWNIIHSVLTGTSLGIVSTSHHGDSVLPLELWRQPNRESGPHTAWPNSRRICNDRNTEQGTFPGHGWGGYWSLPRSFSRAEHILVELVSWFPGSQSSWALASMSPVFQVACAPLGDSAVKTLKRPPAYLELKAALVCSANSGMSSWKHRLWSLFQVHETPLAPSASHPVTWNKRLRLQRQQMHSVPGCMHSILQGSWPSGVPCAQCLSVLVSEMGA